jgi:hypothetical protein
MLILQEVAVVVCLLVLGYLAQDLVAAAKLLGMIALTYIGTTLLYIALGRLIWTICRLCGLADEPSKRSLVFERSRPLVDAVLIVLVYVLVPVFGLHDVFRIILVIWLAYISFASRRSRKLLGLPNNDAAFLAEIAVYLFAFAYLLV